MNILPTVVSVALVLLLRRGPSSGSIWRALALVACLLTSLWPPSVSEGDAGVSDVRALHRNGQTFVTWRDVAEGEAGAKFRYFVYRSDSPITPATLSAATLIQRNLPNNSAKRFGEAFWAKDRLDPARPMATIEEGGSPLPGWSGLAVHTAKVDGDAYYAVLASETGGKPTGPIVPGGNATTAAVTERVSPTAPIKVLDSRERTNGAAQTSITGTNGLPLFLSLHGSDARGGGAGEWGDYYLYFGTEAMGYRDGLPGVFAVYEQRRRGGNVLTLKTRDAIALPGGNGALETYWFGYLVRPEWATHREPRAYPFTERRLLWLLEWTIRRYHADPDRVSAGGQSMGGWGTMTFGLRHPEIFAALYPILPRTRQRALPSLVRNSKAAQAVMEDGRVPYLDRMDMVRFVSAHHADLPFIAWSIGRHDGFASWREQVEMVKALAAARHGFAMAWNNGGHSEGGQAMARVQKFYPAQRFARNLSYPAFSNSSLDDDIGSGDPRDGAPEGGINLGFSWKDPTDESAAWSVELANSLATAPMTVDVTPRRCQRFRPQPGERLTWKTSDGQTGEVVADAWGVVTVPRVRVAPGTDTVLVVARRS